MRIGAHTSSSPSLENAALHAHRVGGNTLQIFTASPRMWAASPPKPDQVAKFRDARERLDLRPLVIHDNYLINMASLDEGIRSKSIAAYRGEVERALTLEADYLVAHPGSYKDQTVEQAIEILAQSLAEAVKGLKSKRLTLLLENTAGQGSSLGSRFEELTEIRRQLTPKVEFEIGYCIDTAHSFEAGLTDMAEEIATTLGFERVPVIHANDSKTPFNSRVDRHEHIGEGYIGEEPFRRILTHPKLRDKAFILETPLDKEGDDARNIETLKRLCRKSPTTRTRSS
jgi:deoxyribonuclease-4